MTADEALLWLAGLEKDCPETAGAVSLPFCESHCNCAHHQEWRCRVCGGTGKVPVLDLRELCPWGASHRKFAENKTYPIYDSLICPHFKFPKPKGCPGWLPKQGRDALYEAMHNAGWSIHHYWGVDDAKGKEPHYTSFYSQGKNSGEAYGEDGNPYVAAVKAMKKAGHV